MESEFRDGRQSSRVQEEIASQILQEEAQRALSGTPGLNLMLSINPEAKPVYGPTLDDAAGFKSHGQDDVRMYRGELQQTYGSAKSVREMRDEVADKVFSGFGRFQSADKNWRLDYLDPSDCDTKAQVGLCFKFKH